MAYAISDLRSIWEKYGRLPLKSPGKFTNQAWVIEASHKIAKYLDVPYEEVKGKQRNHQWMAPSLLAEVYELWIKAGTVEAKNYLNEQLIPRLSNQAIKRFEEHRNSQNTNPSLDVMDLAKATAALKASLINTSSSCLITHQAIANNLEFSSAFILKLIEKHRAGLQVYGKLQVEATSSQPGESIVLLSEEQALYLMTLCPNSPKAAFFKHVLISAFYEMKQLLKNNQSSVLPSESIEVKNEYVEILGEFGYLQTEILAWQKKMQSLGSSSMSQAMISELLKQLTTVSPDSESTKQFNKKLPLKEIVKELRYEFTDEDKKNLAPKVAQAYRDAYGIAPENEMIDYGEDYGKLPRNIYYTRDPVVIATIHQHKSHPF